MQIRLTDEAASVNIGSSSTSRTAIPSSLTSAGVGSEWSSSIVLFQPHHGEGSHGPGVYAGNRGDWRVQRHNGDIWVEALPLESNAMLLEHDWDSTRTVFNSSASPNDAIQVTHRHWMSCFLQW